MPGSELNAALVGALSVSPQGPVWQPYSVILTSPWSPWSPLVEDTLSVFPCFSRRVLVRVFCRLPLNLGLLDVFW